MIIPIPKPYSKNLLFFQHNQPYAPSSDCQRHNDIPVQCTPTEGEIKKLFFNQIKHKSWKFEISKTWLDFPDFFFMKLSNSKKLSYSIKYYGSFFSPIFPLLARTHRKNGIESPLAWLLLT